MRKRLWLMLTMFFNKQSLGVCSWIHCTWYRYKGSSLSTRQVVDCETCTRQAIACILVDIATIISIMASSKTNDLWISAWPTFDQEAKKDPIACNCWIVLQLGNHSLCTFVTPLLLHCFHGNYNCSTVN